MGSGRARGDGNGNSATAGVAGRVAPGLEKLVRVGMSEVLRNRAFHVRREALRAREYLDIGCGPNVHPGFIALDYRWFPGVDICWDVGRGIPLESESLKGVFSEHCVEHLSIETGDALLGECFRLLQPGGTLRLVTPDAELYLTGYTRSLDGEDASLPRAERDRYDGLYTTVMSVNRVFCHFGHRFIYDFETLRELLARHGYVDIARAAFGEGRDAGLLIETSRRAPGSLYVEASKPDAGRDAR